MNWENIYNKHEKSRIIANDWKITTQWKNEQSSCTAVVEKEKTKGLVAWTKIQLY